MPTFIKRDGRERHHLILVLPCRPASRPGMLPPNHTLIPSLVNATAPVAAEFSLPAPDSPANPPVPAVRTAPTSSIAAPAGGTTLANASVGGVSWSAPAETICDT